MQTPNPAQTFLIEAADLLDQVEEIALEVERRPEDRESINRLFRAFHTIKGSGAMFGFDRVASFTHHVESALDALRQGTLTVSPALIQVVLASRDHIQRLLAPDAANASELDEVGRRLVGELQRLGAIPPAATARGATEETKVGDAIGCATTYRIRFKPNPLIGTSGLDPASVLDELRRLGPCNLTPDLSAIPPLERLEPTQCVLAWTIGLTTDRGIDAIRDVFIFVEDGSELKIERDVEPVRLPAMKASPPPATDPSAITAAVTNAAPSEAAGVPSANVGASGAEAGKTALARSAREGVVRVPSAKLDHMVSLVGELVMNESRLSQVAARLNVAELGGPVEAIERLIAELRDAVLGIRMMPIGSTFSRFKRLVHDLSRDLGKKVELVTEGAETELDKTVLDQLADPLVHLIRNSIDHGIESPNDRVAAGKSANGTIRLAASHQGSHVVLTIEDDGRGLDAQAIRAKAVEKQLISADANLGEAEIFNLIFLPGFSTARQVTEVSGRGVGMDVVRRQIDALRGGIQLSSVRGHGTTIALSLPLTLAIIEGLLVTVAGDPFIIPMSVVMENVELRRAERSRNNGRNLVNVRGELVPYLHLRELFGIPGEEPEIEKIVIARFGRDRVGLVVDRVLGSHQTVIQSLGRMFKDIGVVSGGTILGDGRVALILDLSGVVACAEKRRNAELARSFVSTAAA